MKERRKREGGGEDLRKCNSHVGVWTEMESKEGAFLIEGVIIGLVRNLPLEKFPGIPRMILTKT